MNRLFLVLGVLLPALVYGCTESLSPGSSSRRMTASRITKLRETAERLAETELARMSAAELIYRNKSRLHTTVEPVLGMKVGAYLKMYRTFTGYEVEDIVLSDSLLHPITFEIRYQYDVMGTTQRSMSLPNGLELSTKDREFEVLHRSGVTQRYRCDERGNYTGELTSLLPRPDLYSLREELEGKKEDTQPVEAVVISPPPSGFASAGRRAPGAFSPSSSAGSSGGGSPRPLNRP